MRAQVQSWREAHRKELDQDQLALIDEMLTIIKPELYSAQTPDERLQAQEKTLELRERATVHFTPRQIRELIFLQSTE